jgi:hypothetical protein
MFSRFAVYIGDKTVLMRRNNPKHPEDNGAISFSGARPVFGWRMSRDPDLSNARRGMQVHI